MLYSGAPRCAPDEQVWIEHYTYISEWIIILRLTAIGIYASAKSKNWNRRSCELQINSEKVIRNRNTMVFGDFHARSWNSTVQIINGSFGEHI